MQPTMIVHGAAGRMGRRIIALATEEKRFRLVEAVDHPQSPFLQEDAGRLAGVGELGVPVTDTLKTKCDVVIDFSLPQAADEVIDFCTENKIALVMGTTGLTEAHLERLREAGKSIAIVQATNMSVGMNLLFSLVGKIAKSLGEEYDIEIVEAHHRFKKDAPSGSALSLAKAICDETGRDYAGDLVHGREGKDALRQKGTIGMHAIRGGDIVGRHSVMYTTLGETVTISHEAHNRDTLARGALTAAGWVVRQKPGLYSMKDVLGLT
jgi:4-hydroxy-tetrahydrodipicolinate reductase